MKKLALAAVATAALALPSFASAQTSTASVTAEATIQASLTATKTADLRFGNVIIGQNSTLDPSATTVSTASTTGVGNIAVQHNSNFSLSATVPTSLTLTTDATKSLATAFTCRYFDNAATALGAGNFGCGDAVGGTATGAIGRFDAATPGTTQTTNLRVGGTLTGNAAMPLGTYRGALTFTFTAIN